MRKAYLILGGLALLVGGFVLGWLIEGGWGLGIRPWWWGRHLSIMGAWGTPWMFGLGWLIMALLWLAPVGLLVALIVLLARRA